MRLRAAGAVAFVAVCAVIAAPAASARAAQPVEVARAGKATLRASEEGKQLCISLDSLERACAEAYGGAVTTGGLGATDPPYVGAVVPAAAARIEVRRAGVLLAAGPTVAGEAYKGVRAGSVRFALVRLPKAARTDGLRVRALDAAGSLISVMALSDDAGELLLGRTRLLKGRSRDVTWSVTAERRSTLTPSLLDVAHETLSDCVVVTLNGLDHGRACESGLPNDSLAGIDLARAADAGTCSPPFRLLHGVVDGSVMAVTVVLGDGRQRTVRTVPVGDGRRTYAVATGTGAVRSVTIPGRGVLRPGLAPMSAMCTDGGLISLLIGTNNAALGPLALLLQRPPVTPAGPVTTIPGSPAMQVADGPADTLCIALAGQPFDALGCSIVSPLISDQLGVVDNLLDPHALALAVPAQVATVRLSSTDGKVVRDIPTDPGSGYSGRYAGRVRFVAISLTNTAEFARSELLDAAGKVLFDSRDDTSEDVFTVPRVGQARRVAGRAGAPSLWQTNVRDGTLTERCLSLTAGPAPGPTENCQSTGSDAVLLAASCVTHRLSVAIAVRAGTRVVADMGGATRRTVRLRRRMAILTVPGARPLRSLTFIRKGRKRRVQIGAPPAARQCGWHFSPDVEDY
jgi:hypothetical protein